VLPFLVLLLHWSVALTELLLLRIKASEAARRALWETMAGRAPTVVEESGSGLWTSRPLRFRTSIEMRAPVAGLGVAHRFGFDSYGAAAVRVRLDDVPLPAWVLPGGALRGGGAELARPRTLASVESPVASAAPLQLVFDSWRAWPATRADPAQTYPIVEQQVSRRVSSIAFFGLRGAPVFERVARTLDGAFSSATARAALGGRPSALFATGTFADGGPITILPPGPADAAFVPNTCDARRTCANTRAGDVLGSDDPPRLGGAEAFSDGEDSARATVPFRIHGRYWTRSGGSDGDRGTAAKPYPSRLATNNAYVASWNCRGHFFAGAVRAEEPDVDKRYREPCR
jgi:hypothetical protein